MHERRRASAEGIEERQEARELTDVEAVRRQEARQVRAALSALPGDQSRVIELAYYGGFTQSELAERLGEPLGTITSRMFTGLARLRELLDEGTLEGTWTRPSTS